MVFLPNICTCLCGADSYAKKIILKMRGCIPAVIFLVCLGLEQKSSFLDGHSLPEFSKNSFTVWHYNCLTQSSVSGFEF